MLNIRSSFISCSSRWRKQTSRKVSPLIKFLIFCDQTSASKLLLLHIWSFSHVGTIRSFATFVTERIFQPGVFFLLSLSSVGLQLRCSCFITQVFSRWSLDHRLGSDTQILQRRFGLFPSHVCGMFAGGLQVAPKLLPLLGSEVFLLSSFFTSVKSKMFWSYSKKRVFNLQTKVFQQF